MRKKSARLIQKTHLFRGDEYCCSSCGFTAQRPFRTCPRCGASMKGSKYDANWVDEMEMIDISLDD